MPKIKFRTKEAFVAFGGIIGTIGGVLMGILPNTIYIGGAVSLIGVLLLLYGYYEIKGSDVRIINEWNAELIYKFLTNAPADSTISILQTSIPDVTRLTGQLENLLINKNKQFRLQLLLVDYENAFGLIESRVRHRAEKARDHANEVRENIDRFIQLKNRVDEKWKDKRSQAKLDLEIRLYSFLPFGSIYQVGKARIFSGIYWNWTSSINGPMIAIKDNNSIMWEYFEKQFTEGWEKARIIYPPSV